MTGLRLCACHATTSLIKKNVPKRSQSCAASQAPLGFLCRPLCATPPPMLAEQDDVPGDVSVAPSPFAAPVLLYADEDIFHYM